jgi:pimeloyl-ACP methyl ester carboxylesterase
MTSYRSIDVLFQNELNTSTADIKNYQLNSYYDGKWKQEYNKWLDIQTGWRLGKDYTLIAWNSALTTDMIFTQPVLYEFKNIKTPTVLIIGQRDRTAIGKAWAPPEYKDKMKVFFKNPNASPESMAYDVGRIYIGYAFASQICHTSC